jgi:hypothetical protein
MAPGSLAAGLALGAAPGKAGAGKRRAWSPHQGLVIFEILELEIRVHETAIELRESSTSTCFVLQDVAF